MPTVTYIQANGESHEVELDVGTSLMQGAVDNMNDGILAWTTMLKLDIPRVIRISAFYQIFLLK